MTKNKIPKQGTPEYKVYMKALQKKGGRNKKGTKHKTTIEREKVLEMAKDIIAGRTNGLINIQGTLAKGGVKVFRIDSYYEYFMVGKTEKRTKKTKKPVLIDDDDEITAVLDHEFGTGDSTEHPNTDTEYYFVFTKDPDNKAIDSLLDRTFGKATQTQEIKIKTIEVDDDTKRMAKLALSSLLKNG